LIDEPLRLKLLHWEMRQKEFEDWARKTGWRD
jgi:hypothetical protein